jgi:putative oxygen-independent coproporphyrinogen III oxidase
VPSTLPEGDPVPADGALPGSALDGLGARPFGFYVHVPFCVTRCGYCDFNTYTAAELAPGAGRDSYADTVIAEIRFARRVLGDVELPVQTVFVGGGTPTLLPPGDLGRVLGAIRTEFGLAGEAEITTEANPETVDPASLHELKAAGFTRVSYGMQSARPNVLRVLDRAHTPERVPQVVRWAREAGFEHVNLDLIYGTPGESDEDWRASLDAVLAAGVDHVSAYALIVEEGTRLAAQVRRGELAAPDDDVMADRYAMADEVLGAHGLAWYEISNWAVEPEARCRHNILYWTGADWWGAGPGAHSHIGGTRWWNVKHPAAYAKRLAAGAAPAHAREVLAADDRRVERIMLELRLADGCPLDLLGEAGEKAAMRAVADGLLDADAYHNRGRAVLTLRGRLLADALTRELT